MMRPSTLQGGAKYVPLLSCLAVTVDGTVPGNRITAVSCFPGDLG